MAASVPSTWAHAIYRTPFSPEVKSSNGVMCLSNQPLDHGSCGTGIWRFVADHPQPIRSNDSWWLLSGLHGHEQHTVCVIHQMSPANELRPAAEAHQTAIEWHGVSKWTIINKKALLSQRRPRDAPNVWVPWKVSRVLANAPGYFSRNL